MILSSGYAFGTENTYPRDNDGDYYAPASAYRPDAQQNDEYLQNRSSTLDKKAEMKRAMRAQHYKDYYGDDYRRYQDAPESPQHQKRRAPIDNDTDYIPQHHQSDERGVSPGKRSRQERQYPGDNDSDYVPSWSDYDRYKDSNRSDSGKKRRSKYGQFEKRKKINRPYGQLEAPEPEKPKQKKDELQDVFPLHYF